jgi:hypothetical protein
MANRETKLELLARGEIVEAPAGRACRDQCFELPRGIYIAMALMFAGFFAILATAFRGGHMAVGYGVISAFIATFFAVPAAFPNVGRKDGRNRARSWFDFSDRGMMTATGHSSAGEATILVLLLPFLVLCFGIAVTTIAALN